LNAEETNNWFFKQNLKIIASLERSIINNENIIKITNNELDKLFVNEYDVERLEKIISYAKNSIKEDKKSIKKFKEINLMAFSKN
jgi:hypothetical protein|tara:strand:- start:11360 stop:11614 length:255 start_codon:yes stop_codon:yes gene_type:complete